MNNRYLTTGFLFLFFSLVSVIGAAEKTKPSVPPRSSEFVLQDQFDQSHEMKFPRDKATVLVVADQPGSKQLEGWIKPIYARYETKIEIAGIADLGPVPARLRNFVQKSFRKESSYPILLDWSGKVCDSFGYARKKANLYVIAPDGAILIHASGPATSEILQKIYAELEKLSRNGKK